jgi:hypothetical protein
LAEMIMMTAMMMTVGGDDYDDGHDDEHLTYG